MVLHTSFIGNLVTRGVSTVAGFLGNLFTGGGAAATAARGIATIGAGTAVGIGAASLFTDDEVARPGGAGASNRTRTIVQTIDPAGTVVKQQVLRGSPHLMRRDLLTAKRVFRLASKLHEKLPRRTVKESEITQLKNRIVKKALDKAADPCPPAA